MNGIRSLASGHCAVHLLHCGAMVYLFAATVSESGGMTMTGMIDATSAIEYPTLALAFASVLAGYTARDIGRRSVLRRRVVGGVSRRCSRRHRAAGGRGGPHRPRRPGATMAFMLLVTV